jgi:hypothetical protein
MPLVEQELLTRPEQLSSPPVFSWVRVTRSLVLCVCFVDRCLSFFFWPLCCLFCTFPRITVGDDVLLQDTKKYKGLSKKFQFRWIGPFTVTHVISDVLYKIQEKPKTKPKVIHVNRLKPYQGYMKRWYQPHGEPVLNTRGRCLNNTQ